MNNLQAQTVGEVFLEQVASQPNATALLLPRGDDLQSMSWLALAQKVRDALQQFDRHRVQSGAHIATWLPNGLAWIVIDLACQLRGAVHVAFDWRLPLETALRLTEHADAQMLLVPDDQAVRQAAPTGHLQSTSCFAVGSITDSVSNDERDLTGEHLHLELTRSARSFAGPDKAAQMLYTSGTMSAPKGVLLSHRNLLSNALAKLSAAPQIAADVRLNVLPFAHAYARTCELSTWIISGSQLCVARDWPEFLRLCPRVQPTLVNLVPHLAQKLVAALDAAAHNTSRRAAGESLLGGRLRLLQVGGAALPRAVWDRLADQGWPPLQGYGLTEASPVICSNRAGSRRWDSVGSGVPGVELRVDDRGVLWTRGPHVMLGYWKDSPSTAAKIQDGWLSTGDLAEIMTDGRVRIIGRADDQIALSTGYKASPHELASRLAHDPWVDQLVIVGQDRPHLAALVYPRWTELPGDLFDCAIDARRADPRPHLCTARFERALVERWSVVQADLPRQLRIERVGVLRQPLASENGGLNFKGAIRRKFAEQTLLAEEVAELYRTR